jgi:RimJ/RimL family protein N-acetyltransferase
MSFWPRPFTKEETRVWIERSMQSYKEHRHGRWAVTLKLDGGLIGDIGIIRTQIDDKPENDFGYIISNQYWNKGFATEAAEACRDYGFKKLRLKRLAANMSFDNIASIRVAEKIGMKREKEFYNKRNRNILTFLYAINM